MHPFCLYTRHDGPATQIALSWRGPGFGVQPIPSDVWFMQSDPGTLTAVPDFAQTRGPHPVFIPVVQNDFPAGFTLQSAGPAQGGSIVL